MGKIQLNVVKRKSKKTGISNRFFFHILHGEYLSKHKFVVMQTPEWEFKANISLEMLNLKNVKANFLPDLSQKLQKIDYFQEFRFY